MLRCPLRSCQHKVLNNVYIKESLSQHCANYHNNDLKHYIFYYKINHKWETFFYPPLHLQNNPREQNPQIAKTTITKSHHSPQNKIKQIYSKNHHPFVPHCIYKIIHANKFPQLAKTKIRKSHQSP